jgi:hypothetical protein
MKIFRVAVAAALETLALARPPMLHAVAGVLVIVVAVELVVLALIYLFLDP